MIADSPVRVCIRTGNIGHMKEPLPVWHLCGEQHPSPLAAHDHGTTNPLWRFSCNKIKSPGLQPTVVTS